MRRAAAALTLTVAILTIAPSLGAEQAAPWENARFTSDAKSLLVAAKAELVPKDADLLFLTDETRIEIDADGRRTTTHYQAIRVVTDDGVDYWSEVGTEWLPWLDEKPRIRARVITPKGRVVELDPKTIDDAPAGDGEEIYSDRRNLRAPLPAIEVGAIIEQEIVTREHSTFFARGVSSRWWIGGFQPARQNRLIIDAPEASSLRHANRGTSLAPARSESNGRVKLLWESGPTGAWKAGEMWIPSDQTRYPFVAWSTGESWQSIASRYASIVDEQLEGADVSALLHGIKTKGRPRNAIITDLMKALHAKIRYTGVEFGEASIVPRKPAETLGRGYGDCKDKATLLIAMLRASGIDARAALLSAGGGTDVDPGLPGLGLFNHVIVFVPGSPELWIDATDEYSRVGVVPSGDQDRLALVAAESTRELVRIPASASSDNRIVEKRDVFLSDYGNGRIVETSHPTGSIESEYRQSYEGATEKEALSSLESYSQDNYISKKISGLRWTDIDDLSKPFELRFEVADAGRAVTDLGECAVGLFPSSVTGRLPYLLTTKPAEKKKGDAGESDDADEDENDKTRKNDFVFDEPFIFEQRYRIVPPKGFRPATLPESKSLPLGTSTLTSEYKAEADGTITAVLRFDSGKRRITAEEFTTMRDAVVALGEEPAVLVRFEHTGQMHLERGEVREALEIFRREQKDEPKKAMPHVRTALALLEAGLSEEARAEIAKATAIEPSNAFVHGQRGWILQHDLLGRHMRKGYDRAGAIAEYHKVKELTPDDILQRANLAIVLEHDDEGRRYASSPADLDAAIEEYRSIGDRIGELGVRYRSNLPMALMHAGRFEEMIATAKADREIQQRDEVMLTGDIILHGGGRVDEAITRAGIERTKRSEALRRIGQTLVSLRHYAEAAAVLEESARGSRDAAAITAQVSVIKKVKKAETLELPPSDPASVVRRLFIRFFDTKATGAQLLELFVNTEDDEEEGLETIMGAGRRVAQNAGVPGEVLCDITLAIAQFTTEGNDATGYRVRVRGSAGSGDIDEVLYVVKTNDGYRILASEHTPNILGEEAVARVGRNDLAGARQLIEWAREGSFVMSDDDPLVGEPIGVLWKKGLEGDERQIRIAAACLLAKNEKTAQRAIEILTAAREGAAPEEANAIDHAIVNAAGNAKKFDVALVVAERLRDAYPESDSAFGFHIAALAGLGRWSDAESVARKRLDADASDPETIRALLNIIGSQGRYAEAKAMFERIVALGKAGPSDYNQVAWSSIAAGHPEEGVDLAQQAVSMGGSKSSAILNTLAAIYAELGQTTQAKLTVWESLDVAMAEEPREQDWYVLGRMAEQYGLTDSAKSAYKKIPREKLDREDPLSIQAFTSHRLKVMEGTAKKKK